MRGRGKERERERESKREAMMNGIAEKTGWMDNRKERRAWRFIVLFIVVNIFFM